VTIVSAICGDRDKERVQDYMMSLVMLNISVPHLYDIR